MKTSYFFNYGRRFILFFVFLLLLTILLCYRVDPFSIYGRVYTKDGHEVNSPGFTSQLHMGKSAAIKRYKPNIIIMGSSRAAFGLSASSSEKYFPQQNVYNMAFPGASAYESLRYFQHAIASSDIKQAFISLDFFQYHGGRALPSSFREERLAVDINNQSTNDPVNDYLSTLLSADAVFYSFKVATGLCDWKSIYLTNGFKYQDFLGSGLWWGIEQAMEFAKQPYAFRKKTLQRVRRENLKEHTVENQVQAYMTQIYEPVLKRKLV